MAQEEKPTFDDGETCNDCPYITSHGDCGENYLCINPDGTISYDGETYAEDKFNELLSCFI